MYKLCVIGTVAIDSIETPFGKRDEVFGGSASYFSYTASFFTGVSLVAVVGLDFPPPYYKILEERPIDLSHLQVAEGRTFRWRGRYNYDLNTAETLETQLNVLTDFSPDPKGTEEVEYLFLANIDPDIQLKFLEEIPSPKLKFVACDTMNFWIHYKKQAVYEILRRCDLLIVNDAEARDIAGEPNLIRAARAIQDKGPSRVMIKKGEHGVLLFDDSHFFALPGFPLESVYDPTGAGDSFAGGFMGSLAKTDRLDFEAMKQAAVYGSVMASFCVEEFGLERLRRLKPQEIEERLKAFRRFSSF